MEWLVSRQKVVASCRQTVQVSRLLASEPTSNSVSCLTSLYASNQLGNQLLQVKIRYELWQSFFDGLSSWASWFFL